MDAFYNKKYADAARRLKLLQDRYGDQLDKDEAEDLMAALLELRSQLRKLQWYGEVNRRGFVKITKKLDKKVPDASTQRRYLESKVDPKQFAANVALIDTMKTVNDWLSTLGDVKTLDDNSSTHSSHSLHRASSKTNLNLSTNVVEQIGVMLRRDDAESLMALLTKDSPIQNDVSFVLLKLNILQRAISCRAKACIDELLGQLETLDEEDDINKRNCVHRLVISLGRLQANYDDDEADGSNGYLNAAPKYITPAAAPILAPTACYTKEVDGVKELGRDDKSVVMLQYLLDKLRPRQRSALQARDTYGRMPLHYAAQYGFVIICQIIIVGSFSIFPKSSNLSFKLHLGPW